MGLYNTLQKRYTKKHKLVPFSDRAKQAKQQTFRQRAKSLGHDLTPNLTPKLEKLDRNLIHEEKIEIKEEIIHLKRAIFALNIVKDLINEINNKATFSKKRTEIKKNVGRISIRLGQAIESISELRTDLNHFEKLAERIVYLNKKSNTPLSQNHKNIIVWLEKADYITTHVLAGLTMAKLTTKRLYNLFNQNITTNSDNFDKTIRQAIIYRNNLKKRIDLLLNKGLNPLAKAVRLTWKLDNSANKVIEMEF
jgi:hypothetical protein